MLRRYAVPLAAGVGVGVAVLVAGVRLSPSIGSASGAASAPSAVPAEATEEYGRRLIAHTAELLGPDQGDPDRRFMDSRLNCASCHLAVGTEPGTLTLLQTREHYPRFSGRAGGMTEIEDRINECMQRSMNGRPLPVDSVEMKAMAAYLRGLGGQYDAMSASSRKTDEPPPFATPPRAADRQAGREVFEKRCAICHGGDGLGLLASGDKAKGYLFPPLWGPDSFNTGAGMHRVLTAARFIKARMPLGEPTLTNDEAFDVAAFINDQPRPVMAALENDYPDRSAKPIDNGYGPFADDFPLEQHRFGPFAPIEAYYKALREKK
ncbi:MAG: c-type cytochrome [Acidobacteria bacterium]|nr:c-type cytochrome [Acidobacteriota bacterium]